MAADYETDLPAMAFVEHQILAQAIAQNALAPAARAIERRYGVKEGYFGSGIFFQTRVVSLLYCLIVIPREIWDIKGDHSALENVSRNWNINCIQILNGESGKNLNHSSFVRRLRNAISHAKFRFEKNGDFVFWDQNPRKSDPEFRARINKSDMEGFLSTVGAIFANLRNMRATPKQSPIQ
jgi:hypothetical protein